MMAEALLRSGVRVYIASRNAKRCRDAVQQLASADDWVALPAAVNDPQQRQALVSELTARESQRDSRFWSIVPAQTGAPRWQIILMLPLTRSCAPMSEDIAGMLIYLTSRAAASINGTSIPVSGETSIGKGKRGWSAP